jgi:hypothetical protein
MLEHVFERQSEWAVPGQQPGPCAPLPDPLADALSVTLDGLAAQAPAELPGPAALERTRVLMAELERLRALTLRAIGDVDTRGLAALEEQPSTTAWVQAQAVAGVDRSDVTLARGLRRVPAVTDALLAGDLSRDAAVRLAAAVAKARPFLDRPDGRIDGQPGEATLYGVLVDGVSSLLAEQRGGHLDDAAQLQADLEALVGSGGSQLQRVEAGLLVFARRCAPGLLPSGLALLLDALLPAQHAHRAQAAEDERGVTLSHRGEGYGWNLRGTLDDLTGELFATALAAQAAVDEQNARDTQAWRDAEQAAGADALDTLDPHEWPAALARPRTKAQQRHDALRDLLRRLLDTGALGQRDKTAPHLLITADLDTVHGVPGALPTRGQHGARFSRQQLRELLCGSRFTRMLLDARRRVVDTSHTQRTLTAAERQILHLEWGGYCARAGCCRGPSSGDRLVPHHASLFSTTGATSLDDTVPLCEQDHHLLHAKNAPLRLKNGRTLGPDGWIADVA